jgi:hypothetical protein
VAQAAGSELSLQRAGCHVPAGVIIAPQAITLFHLARALVSRTSARFSAISRRSSICNYSLKDWDSAQRSEPLLLRMSAE